MTQPLALILYQNLLPGTQLVNRLQDLGYRVETLTEPSHLVDRARETLPMLVLADLEFSGNAAFAAISHLKQTAETAHLPVVGFSRDARPELEEPARAAGVTLYVTEASIMNHLGEILEQALRVD